MLVLPNLSFLFLISRVEINIVLSPRVGGTGPGFPVWVLHEIKWVYLTERKTNLKPKLTLATSASSGLGQREGSHACISGHLHLYTAPFSGRGPGLGWRLQFQSLCRDF